ncbi:MAG: hypothetical protein AB8B80_16660 [Marinicellaceae bacterium]
MLFRIIINFDATEFQERAVNASIMYYEKFYPKVKTEVQKKPIASTISTGA